MAAAAVAAAPCLLTRYCAAPSLDAHAARISSRYRRSVEDAPPAFSSHTSCHRLATLSASSKRPTNASGRTLAACFATASGVARELQRQVRRQGASLFRKKRRRRTPGRRRSPLSYIETTSCTSWCVRASVACRATAAVAETAAEVTDWLLSAAAAASSALNSLPACGRRERAAAEAESR